MATRYQVDKDYVVIDDATHQLLQVSDKGFKPNQMP